MTAVTLVREVRVVTVIRSSSGLPGRQGDPGPPGAGFAISGEAPDFASLPLDGLIHSVWMTLDDGRLYKRTADPDRPWVAVALDLSAIEARLAELEASRLPLGSAGQVLVHDGTGWVASDVVPT